jgi:hypothetical protein
MKAPDDKFRLIPDENAAPIVQRIFTMAAAGEGYSAIARAFLAEKIPTPYALAGKKSDKSYTTDYEWDYSTIRAILKNPAYLGHSVHCKKTSVSYKVKKVVQRPQDQWVTVENTHKPLISQATWDLAQAVKATRKRSTKSGTPHMFATLLRCPDCGAPLAKVGDGFTCQRYKLYGKETCSNHYITAKRLAAAVLESIQAVTAEVRQDKAGFIERYTGVNEKQRQQKIGVSRKERDKLTKRLEVLPGLITKAFEQNAGGKLSDDDYAVIMDSYKQEREELTTKLDGLNAAIAEAEQETTGVNEFVALAEQYADLQELDRATLLALIKEIKVHQQYVTEDGQKKQRVDIDYRFIGEL